MGVLSREHVRFRHGGRLDAKTFKCKRTMRAERAPMANVVSMLTPTWRFSKAQRPRGVIGPRTANTVRAAREKPADKLVVAGWSPCALSESPRSTAVILR